MSEEIEMLFKRLVTLATIEEKTPLCAVIVLIPEGGGFPQTMSNMETAEMMELMRFIGNVQPDAVTAMGGETVQ